MLVEPQVIETVDTPAITAALEEDRFTWIDVVDPSPEELDQLQLLLGWPPLLMEDVARLGQRAKVEDYGDVALLVAFATEPAEGAEHARMTEVAFVVHDRYVASVRQREVEGIPELRETVARGTWQSEATVVHRILDLLVDTTMDTVEKIASDVERIERAITADLHPEMLDELRSRRRDLAVVGSVISAQRDALSQAPHVIAQVPGFELGIRDHFRDLHDHAQRVVDTIEVSRRLVDAAFEAYFAMLATRQGEVGQRLALIGTILLPMSVVTGFFGQNFGWLVDNIDTRADFLVLGLGGMLASALVTAMLFRRNHWL